MAQRFQPPDKNDVWVMFDAISATYDKVNRLMTMGLDKYWRKKVADYLPKQSEMSVLDAACGTGDQLIAVMERSNQISLGCGIDLASEMIAIGRDKLAQKPYREKVELQVASALDLPYPDETFDCATMSFGIRNVTDVPLCLQEIRRVLKPKGRILILECSLPKNPFIKSAHLFYMRKVMPLLGGRISKHRQAYRYLNRSAETFPSGPVFCRLLENAGFMNVKDHPLTMGVVSIYQGDRL